jgi:hypothetical protein
MKLSRILMACLMTAVGSSALAAKFNLKMGHAVNATDGQHAAAMKLAELVKQRTNGDVEITIFPANQLGNDAAMINGTRGGTIDIVSSGASNYNGIVANTAGTISFSGAEFINDAGALVGIRGRLDLPGVLPTDAGTIDRSGATLLDVQVAVESIRLVFSGAMDVASVTRVAAYALTGSGGDGEGGGP